MDHQRDEILTLKLSDLSIVIVSVCIKYEENSNLATIWI